MSLLLPLSTTLCDCESHHSDFVAGTGTEIVFIFRFGSGFQIFLLLFSVFKFLNCFLRGSGSDTYNFKIKASAVFMNIGIFYIPQTYKHINYLRKYYKDKMQVMATSKNEKRTINCWTNKITLDKIFKKFYHSTTLSPTLLLTCEKYCQIQYCNLNETTHDKNVS